MIDIRQSKNYAVYLRSQGWTVERIDNVNYFIKKLPILGSVLKIQRPKHISNKVIKILTEKYKTFQIIIEPNTKAQAASLMQYGYKLNKNPYLPSKTLHLDLTRSESKIYANFSKDCRYAIRRGTQNIIKEYSTPKEIEIFHKAWKKSVNFSRFVPSFTSLITLKKSFPNNTSIFLASHNKSSNIIGGAIFTRSSHDFDSEADGIGYYWYGFTNKEGRTSLSQYSLLYQGILWGKKMGCKIFDFEGIYDDRFPQRSWLGFTHFKKQFGGTEILYPGCYTKYQFPF